jgi:hypothetical protein
MTVPDTTYFLLNVCSLLTSTVCKRQSQVFVDRWLGNMSLDIDFAGAGS